MFGYLDYPERMRNENVGGQLVSLMKLKSRNAPCCHSLAQVVLPVGFARWLADSQLGIGHAGKSITTAPSSRA